MRTYDIHHQVGIKASPEIIYQALTDVKKLAGWWTSDTRGNGSKVGGILEFWFGGFCLKFKVSTLEPNQLVGWQSLQEGVDEWAGTEIRFSLLEDESQCLVNFVHAGWASTEGIFPHCSTKWAVFLLSLKDLLEKGKGRPFPDDIEVNHD